MPRSKSIFLFVFIFIASFTTLSAQKIYQSSWKKESAIFGTSAGLFLGKYLIEKNRDPISLELLSILNKEDINSIDRGTVGNFSDRAAGDSDYFQYGLLAAPFTLFLSKQGRKNFGHIFIMYTEVFVFNKAFTQFNKAAFGRYRPYTYNPDSPLDLKLQETTRRSFFSGHVSGVASLSFFTASVYSDLYPESNYRYLVWAGAITAPAITAYLRVKAGRHFPTDVIVGYGVGALVGYFIPRFHKTGAMSEISIISSNNGIGLVYQF